MPEYLAPGVYVEETSFRARSIEGVGTSVAAIVGPTRTGPVRGIPEVITSYAEYVRIYGDARDLTLKNVDYLNHTALAAKAFFDNGGKQLYVSRIVNGVNDTNSDGTGKSATVGSKQSSSGEIKFSSRFPGAMGNYELEILWRDNPMRLGLDATETLTDGEHFYLECSALPNTAKAGNNGLAAGKFPVNIRAAVVKRNGNNLDIVALDAVDNNDSPVTAAQLTSALILAKLPAGQTRTYRVRLNPPTGGTHAEGGAVRLSVPSEVDLKPFNGNNDWSSDKTLVATLNATGDKLTILAAENASVTSDTTLSVAALAIESSKVLARKAVGSAKTRVVQRNFDIDVISDGERIYSVANVSTAPTGNNSLANRLPKAPEKRADQLSQPVACTLKANISGGAIYTALRSLFDAAALNPDPLDPKGPRNIILLKNGSDGHPPQAADYGGEVDELKGSCGFAALESIEDISIVMAPAASAQAPKADLDDLHKGVIAAMQKHCNKMRYRIGVVDSREDMSIAEVRDLRNNFDDSRLALYYPWVVAVDPEGSSSGRNTITLPPAGFISGVYARTDVTRGVHKAPANEPMFGALRFAQDINSFQQELLNPDGINCLRSFPGRGHRVWGGRTLSSDPEWKYVNVRRYFAYLERSIEKGTQWAVFEPNGEALWVNIRTTIEEFLYNEWRNGRLLGEKPDNAYFVRCDRSTMTQNDLDNGRLVSLIGVAPLKPAEFVIFRIGQKTADA